jgi:hypothetical protein
VTRYALPLLIRLTLLALCSVFAVPSLHAQTLTLTWGASIPGAADDPVTGYVVYLGTRSLVYDAGVDVQNVLTFSVSWPADMPAYASVLAYSQSGVRSDLSAEASWTPPLPPPLPPPPCTFTLLGPGGVLGNGFATGELTLSASASTCAWTAASSEAWLTLTPASGTGAGTLAFAAQVNTVPSERSASVTIGDAVITIRQAAAVPLPPPADTAPPDVGLRVTRSGNSNNFTAIITSQAADAVRADVYVDGTRRAGTISFISPYMPKLVIPARGLHIIRADVRDQTGNVGVADITVTR